MNYLNSPTDFYHCSNKYHLPINFFLEHSYININFLDTIIHVQNGTSQLYAKKPPWITDLYKTSDHPKHTKEASSVGWHLGNKLVQRGMSCHIVNNLLHKAKQVVTHKSSCLSDPVNLRYHLTLTSTCLQTKCS